MTLESILNYFNAEGVWAILSVFLIFYILKDQEKRDERQESREGKYQEVITGLTAALQDMEEIKDTLKEKFNK